MNTRRCQKLLITNNFVQYLKKIMYETGGRCKYRQLFRHSVYKKYVVVKRRRPHKGISTVKDGNTIK